MKKKNKPYHPPLTKQEYDKFLRKKMEELIDKITKDEKLLNVFKRLNDR